MFVYPPYARCPSEFDRFWYLFMCAAGEMRVRYVYLCVLVVFTKKSAIVSVSFYMTRYCIHLLHEPHISIHVYEPYILAEFVELHLPLEPYIFSNISTFMAFRQRDYICYIVVV